MNRFCILGGTLFLLIVLPTPSWAVDSFGVVGGVNVSSWASDAEYQEELQAPGMTIGGYASWAIASNVAVVLEGVYSQRHFDLEQTVRSAYSIPHRIVKFRTQFDYWEFPVLVKMNKPVTNSSSVFLIAGPAVSFEVNAKFEIELPEGTHSAGDTSGELSETRSPDLGAVLGLGFETRLNGRSVALSARYNLGLRKVADPFGEPKNRAFLGLISVGF
jgi:hypothetical protein